MTIALYFQASWIERFRRENTRNDWFYLSRWHHVTVPMMNKHSFSLVCGYADMGSYQVLMLPCGTMDFGSAEEASRYSQFEFVVAVHRQTTGLAELEASLTPEVIQSWWQFHKHPDEIIIALPKLQFRTEMELGRTLTALGMPAAFDPSRADFSGISGAPHDLYVSAATNATWLDVNEEGIEAAAALIAMKPSSFDTAPPPTVRADHPFLFLLREARSGLILFLGRVLNPLETEGTVNRERE